jgi:hypothetical protein
MNREEAKDLFKNDVDSYGKPKAIMSKINLIFDQLQLLKMYHINPNDWGMNWHVCAVSKQAALDAFIQYLKDASDKEAALPHAAQYTQDREVYNRWKKRTLNNLPFDYTIDEYGEGGVTGIEVS